MGILGTIRLGFTLFILAVITFMWGWSEYPSTQGMLLEGLGIALAVVATIVYFDEEVGKQVHPLAKRTGGHLEKLAADLQDDWQSIVDLRPTGLWLMLPLTVLAAIAFVILLIGYDKGQASWRWWSLDVNVIWLSLGAVVVTYLLVRWTWWFRERDFYLPGAFYWIPAVGLVISVALGIYYQEPGEFGKSRAEITAVQSTDGQQPVAVSSGSRTTVIQQPRSFSMPDFHCSGKSCGKALVIVALVVLVLVCIIGSAFIAHFWVLSGAILITLLILVTWRELRVVE